MDLAQLGDAGRAAHERRRRSPVYHEMDVSDLLPDACQRDVKVRFDRCCEPTRAPLAVVTCARRVLAVALVALGPPVSKRLDVHVCHIAGQLGVQVTAVDRRSSARLLAMDSGRRSIVELGVWLGVFSRSVRWSRCGAIGRISPPSCPSIPTHPGRYPNAAS